MLNGENRKFVQLKYKSCSEILNYYFERIKFKVSRIFVILVWKGIRKLTYSKYIGGSICYFERFIYNFSQKKISSFPTVKNKIRKNQETNKRIIHFLYLFVAFMLRFSSWLFFTFQSCLKGNSFDLECIVLNIMQDFIFQLGQVVPQTLLIKVPFQ
eukprot:TRINITY_DN36987_c3_g1_i1.p1 TRINITY_DN36987_c3_g1~~TRINITY_DN36987_c3_g1_i1.p1  ORF type:complete len:156 (+),score=1.69 TRINITY_DN36987_c3_g1_i1:232-699(+)